MFLQGREASELLGHSEQVAFLPCGSRELHAQRQATRSPAKGGTKRAVL